jgi:hypothetical protein
VTNSDPSGLDDAIAVGSAATFRHNTVEAAMVQAIIASQEYQDYEGGEITVSEGSAKNGDTFADIVLHAGNGETYVWEVKPTGSAKAGSEQLAGYITTLVDSGTEAEPGFALPNTTVQVPTYYERDRNGGRLTPDISGVVLIASSSTKFNGVITYRSGLPKKAASNSPSPSSPQDLADQLSELLTTIGNVLDAEAVVLALSPIAKQLEILLAIKISQTIGRGARSGDSEITAGPRDGDGDGSGTGSGSTGGGGGSGTTGTNEGEGDPTTTPGGPIGECTFRGALVKVTSEVAREAPLHPVEGRGSTRSLHDVMHLVVQEAGPCPE